MNVFPLIDTFGRVHTNLRISVTDRCNIRCVYCMPSEHVTFRPRAELLTYEEIVRFTRVAARMGVSKLRLTGGEPLVRTDLPHLIRGLAAIPGITDMALTTNGLLLADCAAELKAAGLHRLNISIDTLNDDIFFQISKRRGIAKVIEGILTSSRLGFRKIRLNSVIIPQINASEIVPLAQFARENQVELRFIEFMPLNATGHWEMSEVLTGEAIRALLEQAVGRLRPVLDGDPHQPARDYEYVDGGGRVGFVDSVTQPFCANCNRIRLTADGQIRNCLFSDAGWDVRAVMRETLGDDAAIADLIRDCVRAKWAGHGIQTRDFFKPQRAMNEIGG